MAVLTCAKPFCSELRTRCELQKPLLANLSWAVMTGLTRLDRKELPQDVEEHIRDSTSESSLQASIRRSDRRSVRGVVIIDLTREKRTIHVG
jgi:hypothetical protein